MWAADNRRLFAVHELIGGEASMEIQTAMPWVIGLLALAVVMLWHIARTLDAIRGRLWETTSHRLEAEAKEQAHDLEVAKNNW